VRENMSFEGDGDFYDGGDDDFVCFDGSPNASFVNEATAVTRQFVITIQNKSDKAQDFMLTPGLLWAPGIENTIRVFQALEPTFTIRTDDMDVGVPASDIDYTGDFSPKEGAELISKGFLNDGAFFAIGENMVGEKADPTLMASGSPKTIEEFFAFMAQNPINLLGLKIQSNGDDGVQIANQLQVLTQSPFRDLSSKILNPSTYLDQNSFQKDTVLFNTAGLTLGNQTQLKYRISPAVSEEVARTLSITFICGAVLNSSSALAKKQSKAIRNFGTSIQKFKFNKRS